MNNTFIFNHIVKTGVSTFMLEILPRDNGKLKVIDITYENFTREVILGAYNQCKDKFNAILIEGHKAYGIHNFLTDANYISIIRDPLELAISRYYFEAGTNNWKVLEDEKLLFDKFIDYLVSNEESNYQSKYLLAGDFGDDFRHQKSEQEILNLICNDYFFIGLFEELEVSYFLLCSILGVSTNKTPTRKSRPTLLRPSKEMIPESTAEIFRRNNKIDYALYKNVASSFEKACSDNSIDYAVKEDIKRHFRSELTLGSFEAGCYVGQYNEKLGDNKLKSFMNLLERHFASK